MNNSVADHGNATMRKLWPEDALDGCVRLGRCVGEKCGSVADEDC